MCVSGQEFFCRQFRIWGFQTGPNDGGHSEYVTMPAVERAAQAGEPDPRGGGVDAAGAGDGVADAGLPRADPARRERADLGRRRRAGHDGDPDLPLFGANPIPVVGGAEKVAKARGAGRRQRDRPQVSQDVVAEVKAITGKVGVDVVFEHSGEETWPTSMAALRWGGRLVVCGASTGFDAVTDLRFLWNKQQNLLGSHLSNKAELSAALKAVEAGAIKPVIDTVLSAQRGRQRPAADGGPEGAGQDRLRAVAAPMRDRRHRPHRVGRPTAGRRSSRPPAQIVHLTDPLERAGRRRRRVGRRRWRGWAPRSASTPPLGSDGRSAPILARLGVTVLGAPRDRAPDPRGDDADPAASARSSSSARTCTRTPTTRCPGTSWRMSTACTSPGSTRARCVLARAAPVLVVTARRFESLVESGVRADALVGSRTRPRRAVRPVAAGRAARPRGRHGRRARRHRLHAGRAARAGGRHLRRGRHVRGRRHVRPGGADGRSSGAAVRRRAGGRGGHLEGRVSRAATGRSDW